jgi:hypothetical protein
MGNPATQWTLLSALLFTTLVGRSSASWPDDSLSSSESCNADTEDQKCGQNTQCVKTSVLEKADGTAAEWSEVVGSSDSIQGKCAPKDLVWVTGSLLPNQIRCSEPTATDSDQFECKRTVGGMCSVNEQCCYSYEESCDVTCSSSKCTKKPAEDTSASITPTSTGIVVGAAALASFTL